MPNGREVAERRRGMVGWLQVFDGSLYFELGVFFLHGGTLVVELFPSANGDFHFHPSIFIVQAQGNQRQALFFDFGEQTDDFPFMHQQFSDPVGSVVVDVAEVVVADLHLVELQLQIPADLAVGVDDLHPPGPQAFHFGADQGDTGFVSL